MRLLLKTLNESQPDIMELFIGMCSLSSGFWVVFGVYTPGPALVAWKSMGFAYATWGALLASAGLSRIVSLSCRSRLARWLSAVACIFCWVFITTANVLADPPTSNSALPICIMVGSIWTLFRLSPPVRQGDLPPWVIRAIRQRRPRLPPEAGASPFLSHPF